jgi:hypothetical protein
MESLHTSPIRHALNEFARFIVSCFRLHGTRLLLGGNTHIMQKGLGTLHDRFKVRIRMSNPMHASCFSLILSMPLEVA